jgi:hypothetical protein
MVKSLIDIQYAFIFNAPIDQIISFSDFQWIYDERRQGFNKYCGVLQRECV